MSVNTGKSFSVSIGTVPRQKKTTVDPGTFLLGGQKLVAKKRTEQWKYLGVLFTPEGRMRFEPTTTLSNALLRISKAPLKPQQRLFALRIYLLPGLYHAASLGAIRVGTLKKCHRIIRSTVRRWLDLPADTPVAYFHADIKSGGLGVPSLRWTIPINRLNRLEKLRLSALANTSKAGQYLRYEITKVKDQLNETGVIIDNAMKSTRRFALTATIATPHPPVSGPDGQQLRLASCLPSVFPLTTGTNKSTIQTVNT